MRAAAIAVVLAATCAVLPRPAHTAETLLSDVQQLLDLCHVRNPDHASAMADKIGFGTAITPT